MARKPSTRPATVYDYRRAIWILQVLALEDSVERNAALIETYEDWLGRKPAPVGLHLIIRELAQYALEHGRDEWKGKGK